MRVVLIVLLNLLLFQTKGQVFDIVITNGKIVDGSGAPGTYNDIGILDGKILYIGKKSEYKANQVIDAKGLIVAPGFIDVHTHIEGNDMKVPTVDNFILDGVTTLITGNCGYSNIEIADYFKSLDSIKTSVNVATFVGHNSVRNYVMGDEKRAPNKEELNAMTSIVEKALKEGAIGFSTGLGYVPGTYAQQEEIVQLLKTVSKYNGVYASHIRNEGDKVFESINEVIAQGKEANVSVQISHCKISNKLLWGRANGVIEIVEKARAEGFDIMIDQYPYVASSTSLDSMLPTWALSGGRDSLVNKLNDKVIREKIKVEMLTSLAKRKETNYEFAIVASHRPDTTINGKSIVEINKLKGRDDRAGEQLETIFDLVLAANRTQMVYFIMDERDVVAIMKYPYNMIASDGAISKFGSGMPHPRSYGTNARVLGKYVRDMKVITMEEAIRKMTSLPAKKFNFKNRGVLREGMAADVVIFDESTIKDSSTFEQPHAYSSGIRYVIVNGQLTARDGKHLGVREGVAIKASENK